MGILDIIIFDVELGQCIFFYPRNNPEYGLMVDCGDTPEFNPVDILLAWGLIYSTDGKFILGNLTLTNYDEDHFSGLPHLREKIGISTTNLPKNISSTELIDIKEDLTESLEQVIHLKDTYTEPAPYHLPPYEKKCFFLNQSDFPGEEINTNKLSQVVFVKYNGFTTCIPGDVTVSAWKKLLLKDGFCEWLKKTNLFIASHHGREDGYCKEIFSYCCPECIIFSDKDIIHDTQEGMVSCYTQHISGDGIVFNGKTEDKRKVLTTRNDGNIWIRVEEEGGRVYKTP